MAIKVRGGSRFQPIARRRRRVRERVPPVPTDAVAPGAAGRPPVTSDAGLDVVGDTIFVVPPWAPTTPARCSVSRRCNCLRGLDRKAFQLEVLAILRQAA